MDCDCGLKCGTHFTGEGGDVTNIEKKNLYLLPDELTYMIKIYYVVRMADDLSIMNQKPVEI